MTIIIIYGFNEFNERPNKVQMQQLLPWAKARVNNLEFRMDYYWPIFSLWLIFSQRFTWILQAVLAMETLLGNNMIVSDQ